MKLLSQSERDENAKKENEVCVCGKPALGAWGFQIGYKPPYQYTPHIAYCEEHLEDLIFGLEASVLELHRKLAQLKICHDKKN